MALLIPADSQQPVREVQPRNGTDFQLDELYALLTCDEIDMLSLPEQQYIFFDATGKGAQKPRNERATQLADFATPKELITEMLKLREAGIGVRWLGPPITDETTEVDHLAGDILVCNEGEVR